MPTVALPPQGKFQAFDVNGDPLVGGLLYTYVTNSSTPKATYTDATGGSPNQNPVVLDARGEADVWILTDQNYRFKLHTAADALIWSVDGIGWASPTFEDLTVTDDLTVGGDINGNVVGWLFVGAALESQVITTGTAKITFRLPACTILAARASLTTASSSGNPTFDINDDLTSIFGAQKLRIDEGEKTSTTAGASPTIANPTVADDSEMTVDIDTAGTDAAGWKIGLKLRLTA